MMTKKTAEMIQKAREVFKDRVFTAVQWEAKIDLTLATAAKYGAVKVVPIEHKRVAFQNVASLLKFVNGLAGEDCYDCDWYYVQGEDGKIYNVTTEIRYQMV